MLEPQTNKSWIADCKVEAIMILITSTDASLTSPTISCVNYLIRERVAFGKVLCGRVNCWFDKQL